MIRLLSLVLYLLMGFVQSQSNPFPDCKTGPLSKYPICNSSLSTEERAADLISRMTIDEKIARMITTQEPIDRLGLPGYEWWCEGLHGLAFSPGISFRGDFSAATSFPMPINLGATFDIDLVYRVASVISTEARAFSNAGQAGLSYFTPNINIFRDPRWGRGQETPGEDPFLTSEYVYALIRGLQGGEDPRYLKIGATCKHFDAYDLENWNGTDRHHFDAQVSDQDLVETYLAPFETCLKDSRVTSIMCSYNSINGIPACAHRFLLETIARESFNFQGFVVSDCNAITDILHAHHYTSNDDDTVAAALTAGTDLECGVFYLFHLQDALNSGKVVESDVDRALMRTFNVLIRLGWFDPPEQQVYRQYNRTHVDNNEARALALRSAQESMILLKNMDRALPLNLNQLNNKRIALIGPMADATDTMQGIYYGKAPFLIDPISGFKNLTADKSIDIRHAKGCSVSGRDKREFAAALDLARSSDIVFFLGGIDRSIEREGTDRESIDLPMIQLELIQELEKVVRSPLHVIVMSGGGIDLTYIRDSNQCASLIWMGYPGQSGGLALATVVFGQYNPGGRLPVTIYPASYVNSVSMLDMQMRPSPRNPGRTYKFYTGTPVYEFGFGLSYTTFTYTTSLNNVIQHISIDRFYQIHQLINSIRVNVTNTGDLAGDDVVLAYVSLPNTILGYVAPFRQLFGFQRVHLAVNETVQLFFPFTVENALAVYTDGSSWLHPGLYRITINQQLAISIILDGEPIRL